MRSLFAGLPPLLASRSALAVALAGMSVDGRVTVQFPAPAIVDRRFPSRTPAETECGTPKPEWVWCDDFEQDRLAQYFEFDSAGGAFARATGVGLNGTYGMRARWAPRQVSAGALHLAFGKTPASAIRPVDDGRKNYREVYWRIYLRNQADWIGGGGNKLTRAQILASSNWAQAMIAPVWSGSSPAERSFLMLDPATGVDGNGALQTTHYNDQPHLRFLGSAVGRSPIFTATGVGRWYCIEAHVKLNDGRQSNGSFELWVNGQLEAQRAGLNWIGDYSSYGINTLFIENYWNQGSPQAQERAFDNFVVSTQRIGCDAETLKPGNEVD
jgi:hypothetical protein